jgi:hypothetical protein
MKTRKPVYFILMLVFSAHLVLAQNGMTRLGFKVGVNQPQLWGNDVNSTFNSPTSDMVNFIAGLSVNSKTGKYFWLKHDIQYSKKFITVQMNDIVNGNYASKFKRHYIEIYPVSPAFHFKGFQLFAGPYVGVLLNASIQRKDATGRLYDDSTIFGTPVQNSNYAQKFDYGYVLGVEYEFPFGVNLGFRYTKGFVPVIEDAQSQQQLSIYNNFTSLTVGYSFTGYGKKGKSIK